MTEVLVRMDDRLLADVRIDYEEAVRTCRKTGSAVYLPSEAALWGALRDAGLLERAEGDEWILKS